MIKPEYGIYRDPTKKGRLLWVKAPCMTNVRSLAFCWCLLQSRLLLGFGVWGFRVQGFLLKDLTQVTIMGGLE